MTGFKEQHREQNRERPEVQLKDETATKLICGTCGKPVADKASSNVTRFLFNESRCNCSLQPSRRAELATVSHEDGTEAQNASVEIDPAVRANLGERYDVRSLIGRGGMGAVYKVWDKTLEKIFAIKVLNSTLVEDKNSVKRFEQEATAAKLLDHPNLVAVYDFGIGDKGAPYIVMDYLDGTSLSDVLQKEGYLDAPRAQDIFAQVCEAIAYAHSQSVLHRDIKPNNIILTKGTDGGDFVKLVDFGIAKVLPSQQKAAENLTQTGDIFGSPMYMSPEQCLGNKLDGRSDLYEFGCVMYETLTGNAPFGAENPIKIILKHLNDVPKPISSLPQDYKVSRDLDQLIMRCLEKDPADRYQSASELLKDLEALRDGKALNLKPKKKVVVVTQSQTTAGRGKNLIKAAVLALVLAAIGMVGAITARLPAERPAATAGINSTVDANNLDNLSFKYFNQGEYAKAIPLLQFGIESYKGTNPYYLADNYQHIGKCYLMLKQYADAVPFYEKAIAIYKAHPGYSYFPAEAQTDYAKVLKELGENEKAGMVLSGKYVPNAPAADGMTKQ